MDTSFPVTKIILHHSNTLRTVLYACSRSEATLMEYCIFYIKDAVSII